tara:strand:+ start:962 stop:1819 length:858 start_codon:yes stop_codon:yes gene_type:complete
MNFKHLLVLLISLLLFDSCKSQTFETKTSTESTEIIVNSIKDFIETTSPFFSTKYVKTSDGKDLKFTDYIKNEIDKSKSKGNGYYLATTLCQFSSIIAKLSKEDAKKYGVENNNPDLLKSEYQKYLYLSSSESMSSADYITVYLNAIQSVPFHLKVKNVPVFEDLDKVIYYISNEIESAKTTLTVPLAYKVNILHFTNLYSIVLESYAKYLVIGVLGKEITEYPFTELETKRRNLMPVVNDFSEFNNKYSLLGNTEYTSKINKSSEIIAGYFSIINTAISTIVQE